MEFIETIRAKLLHSLPGIDAQLKMASTIRSKEMQAPSNAHLAGVLILLIEGDKTWNTILIRRTEDSSAHSGQISFPGGKKDPSDTDIIATALRECEEEIGVNRFDIDVLGTLTPLYIPPSNFMVTPTLAYIKNVQAFKPSEKEVQEIIKVPLPMLFDPAIKQQRIIAHSAKKNEDLSTPVYELSSDLIIWGATAMIISEMEHLIEI